MEKSLHLWDEPPSCSDIFLSLIGLVNRESCGTALRGSRTGIIRNVHKCDTAGRTRTPNPSEITVLVGRVVPYPCLVMAHVENFRAHNRTCFTAHTLDIVDHGHFHGVFPFFLGEQSILLSTVSMLNGNTRNALTFQPLRRSSFGTGAFPQPALRSRRSRERLPERISYPTLQVWSGLPPWCVLALARVRSGFVR